MNIPVKAGLAAVLVGFAMQVQAATFCVNKNDTNGSCSTEIQAAVDLAASASLGVDEVHTIAIKAATYKESVVVSADPDLTGLIIKGSGKTIIDPAAVALGPPALTITNNNVSVIGLSVNNVNDTGIVVTGNNFTMSKVSCNNTNGDCAFITGNGAIVTGNKVFASDDDGIHILGNNGLIAKNKFSHVSGAGIRLEGDTHIVEANACSYVSSCLDTQAGSDSITVRRNRTVEHSGRAYQVEGNSALFESNSGVAGSGALITVVGSNPRLLANKAKNDTGGIDVECITDCSSALIERNSVTSAEDAECFLIDLAASGAQVLSNSGKACGRDGFDIRGVGGATIQGNKATAVGFGLEEGFRIDGTGVKTLIKNSATLSGGNGFEVRSAGPHVLEANKSSKNGNDGFHLNANTDGITLTGNTATANIQEGFDNRGDNNVYEANKASGNREGSDFCDLGTGTIRVMENGTDTNKFKSEGDDCVFP